MRELASGGTITITATSSESRSYWSSSDHEYSPNRSQCDAPPHHASSYEVECEHETGEYQVRGGSTCEGCWCVVSLAEVEEYDNAYGSEKDDGEPTRGEVVGC